MRQLKGILQGEFISYQVWSDYLTARLETMSDDPYPRKLADTEVQQWLEIYRQSRLLERMSAQLSGIGEPFWLYLDSREALVLAERACSEPKFERSLLAGIVASEALLSDVGSAYFSPLTTVALGAPLGVGSMPVFAVSGVSPQGTSLSFIANDYRERFIELSRFSQIRTLAQDLSGKNVVLYPLYREIHTVGYLASQIRQARGGAYPSIALIPGQKMVDNEYDYVISEPFFCLWPIVFALLDPEIYHVNVGWGIQALPIFPFIEERDRVVLDFYEVLVFVSDAFFDKTHSTARQVKEAARYLLENYPTILHFCSEETTQRIRDSYRLESSTIVSVTEYLRRPFHDRAKEPSDQVNVVYGGCLPSSDSADDMYHQAFVGAANCYGRENVHLHLFHSPYLFGLGRQTGLEALVEKIGLSGNVHVHRPLDSDGFVRGIAGYDYGTILTRQKDMGVPEYHYFMANKFLAYLQAGLPVLIDAGIEYMARLVQKYRIGIVLEDGDYERIPEILKAADYQALRENVVRYRELFSIEIGAAKVLSLYDGILRRQEFARFAVGMIDTIAASEHRLYYRDQTRQSLVQLQKTVDQVRPTRVVELGTLSGLSLRSWLQADPQLKVTALDLSFEALQKSRELIPCDLSRVTLKQEDILKVDFKELWGEEDRVIFYVDAHDEIGVPIMEHVLNNALPALPKGSRVMVDDVWFTKETLTEESVQRFYHETMLNEIDPLQCFTGYYSSYWKGGSFFGFLEVIPLLEWANQNRVELDFVPGGKAVSFQWSAA